MKRFVFSCFSIIAIVIVIVSAIGIAAPVVSAYISPTRKVAVNSPYVKIWYGKLTDNASNKADLDATVVEGGDWTSADNISWWYKTENGSVFTVVVDETMFDPTTDPGFPSLFPVDIDALLDDSLFGTDDGVWGLLRTTDASNNHSTIDSNIVWFDTDGFTEIAEAKVINMTAGATHDYYMNCKIKYKNLPPEDYVMEIYVDDGGTWEAVSVEFTHDLKAENNEPMWCSYGVIRFDMDNPPPSFGQFSFRSVIKHKASLDDELHARTYHYSAMLVD